MESEAAKLLVVDDDPEIRELIDAYLTKQGFTVGCLASGETLFEYLAEHEVDLIVLDLMLPGEHGLSLASRLKSESDIPIVIISAQGDDVDRIVGLEVGADDYLAKPFNPRELLARIRAVLRRTGRHEEKPEDREEPGVQFGPYELDMAGHRLLRDGEEVSLTSGEFDLLCVFASEPNKVLDRDRILDLLTGAERLPFDRSIDVRVTRLRGKIERDPSQPRYIRTIWGKGYMFCPDGE